MMATAPSMSMSSFILSFALLDYQDEALDAIRRREAEGVRRQLVLLPTGTGMTVMFASLLAGRPDRSLVLAHQDELIRHAVDKIRMVTKGVNVGVIKARENGIGVQVIVACVQTLSGENRW